MARNRCQLSSYDFDGTLSGSKTATKKATKAKSNKPAYWSLDGLFEVTTKQFNVYGTLKFEATHKCRVLYIRGSRIYDKLVKYGSAYRTKVDKGDYITANKAMVKLIRKTK